VLFPYSHGNARKELVWFQTIGILGLSGQLSGGMPLSEGVS
jgi:hypothetical protein